MTSFQALICHLDKNMDNELGKWICIMADVRGKVL
jgi:hypothetical protein